MELSLYIPYVALVALVVFGVIWAISPKTAGKAAIKTVVFIASVLLVAAILAIPGLVRAEEWQGATVNGSVDVSVDDESLYLIVYTTDDGCILSYFDDCELVRGTRIRVMISPYGETIDAEVEEEPVWFPPFFLFGVVATPIANKNKKNRLVQRLVPDFYMTTEPYVAGEPSHLAIDLTSLNIYVFVCMEDKTKSLFILPSIEKAISEVERINKPAFATAFVKAYGQQAVVYSNYKGHLEYWRCSEFSSRINEAYKKLDVQLIPKANKPSITNTHATDIKVISDKEDPVRQLIKVKYSETSDEFTFRCRKAHTPGDFVCVYTKRRGEEKKTYKNVKVTEYFFLHESEVKALANSFGYPDISEVYCDQAIELEEAWSNWKDPADDPELYAPSAEEIAEFESMREVMLGSGYRDF